MQIHVSVTVPNCPCCSHTSVSNCFVATEALSSGTVFVAADGDVLATCGGTPPYNNSYLWANVAAFVGAGPKHGLPVGCVGDAADYGDPPDPTLHQALGAMAPTVGNVNGSPSLLSGLSALWAGFGTQGACAVGVSVDPSIYADVKAWVEAGGLLLLIGEFTGCDGGENNDINAMLSYLGLTVRILSDERDCECTSSDMTIPANMGWKGVINAHHFLADGSYGGNVLGGVWHSCSSSLSGGTCLASLDQPP